MIATRPAKDALRHIDTSGLPFLAQVKIMQVTVATAGAIVVLPRMRAISAASPAAAPLKPYQQNHRMKQPSAPRVTECPGIAWETVLPALSTVYFPIRGPSRHAPTSAVRPPTMWITALPAKSTKPSPASQPAPFQTQPASMGYTTALITPEYTQ